MNQTQAQGNTGSALSGAIVILVNYVYEQFMAWLGHAITVPVAIGNAEQTVLAYILLLWIAREKAAGHDIPIPNGATMETTTTVKP